GADAAAGVLHRPAPRRGRRSAAESGEERDGGVKPRALFCHPERSEGPGGADGAQTHPPRPLATLGVTLPLHWSALLGFLRSRLVPGESVEDDVYRRGDVSVRFDGRKLIVNSDDPEVLARVHRLFDVDADVRAIAKHFA